MDGFIRKPMIYGWIYTIIDDLMDGFILKTIIF